MKYAINVDRPIPTVVKTKRQAEDLLFRLSKRSRISIDTETTGLNIAKDIVVFWSLADSEDARYFLEADTLHLFDPLFQDPSKSWIGSQIKYDANILANSGHPLAGDLMCTLVMDRMLDPRRAHGLKDAYNREFIEYMKSFADTFYPKNSKGKPAKPKGKEMYQILLDKYKTDPEAVIDYASMDAWSVLRLFLRLRHYLQRMYTKHGYTLWHIFLHYEVPLTRVLYEMERDGVPVDEKYINTCQPAVHQAIQDVEKEFYKAAGKIINMSSAPQLASYFYNELGYTPIGKTPTGQYKMNKDSFADLVQQGCSEIELVAKRSKLTKVEGTYIVGMKKWIDPHGVIHTNLNQSRVETSRLSSSDPALQTAQKKASEFIDIRRMFVAPPGQKLLVGDYDQLEMYILGHQSGDERLLHAIAIGRDIHCANVEIIYGEPYEECLAAKLKKDAGLPLNEREKYLCDLRDEIKTVGFGQPNSQAEVKPAQNGEPHWMWAIPCCTARCSVSTCGVCS